MPNHSSLSIEEFDFVDSWSLVLQRVEVLVDLLISLEHDSGDVIKRAVLNTFLEEQVGHLRQLLTDHSAVGGAR